MGIIDSLVVTPERVRIIEYTTDPSRHAEPEYRKQLSAYSHVASAQYPDREIPTHVCYTATNGLIDLLPLDIEQLQDLAIAAASHQELV